MSANQKTTLQNKSFLLQKRNPDVFLNLLQAANNFIKHEDDSVQIWAASRDWFLEEWGRDTFVSLPGLLLYTKRFAEAREVFRRFGRFEKKGLIPNRIQEDEILYNTADASMWFLNSLKKYIEMSGDSDFLNEMMPTVRSIIDGYQNGTSYVLHGKTLGIIADTDGLIFSPAQATWMDANPIPDDLEASITPRNGKAVEINALWYSNLKTVGNWEILLGQKKKAQDLFAFAKQVKKSFRKKFWNASENCLFDVIDGDSHQGALRPNQIFAISHGEDLLTKQQQKQILESVKKDLLTPGGLRTLSPRDSHYIGEYNTYLPMHEKDRAYHQGTVWPWLIGPYIDSVMKVGKSQGVEVDTLRKHSRALLGPLTKFAWESEYKSLPEVFSGDVPYLPGGTTSQAWSVGELVRVLFEYRLVP